jgi:Na+-transporting methylmalonyl-CoA/oxaloacetate decarboxylase gamma subunit
MSSFGVTLFLVLPIAAAMVSSSILARFAPSESKPDNKKERSPKRDSHSDIVDESLAVTRARERREELADPAAAAMQQHVQQIPRQPPHFLRDGEEEEDAQARYANLVPLELRSEFSQMVDAPQHADLSSS